MPGAETAHASGLLGKGRKLFTSLFHVAMASTLRKLKSLVLSQTTDTEQIANLLETASVPLHTGDCRSCPDPCTEGRTSFKLPLSRDLIRLCRCFALVGL